MHPSIVICNGLTRSGSTWSFNVCRALAQLEASRLGQTLSSAYQTDDVLEDTLRRKVAGLPGPAVIKAHGIGPTALAWLRNGRLKAVCTIRDPRDCVASDVAFRGQPMEASVNRLTGELNFMLNNPDYGRTLFIRYEEMMQNSLAHIRLIAAHVQIAADDATLKAIDEQTSMEATQRICDRIKELPSDQVAIQADHRFDRVTQLHENHLGSGQVGRWRDELSPETGRKLTAYFKPALLFLGYETEESIASLQGA